MTRSATWTWGLGVLFLALLGCGSRTDLGATEETPARDGGAPEIGDAAAPGEIGDAAAPRACGAGYSCARPRRLGAEARIDFGVVSGGNVQLGKGFLGPRGPTVAWGSHTCCNPDAYAASGIAVLAAAAEVVTVAGPTPTTNWEIPLPMLVNEGFLLGLDPMRAYGRGRRVDLGTLALGPAFESALRSPMDQPPSLERSGNRAFALLGSPPRLWTLDTNLSTVLAEQTLDETGVSPILTRACDGFVASWVDVRETEEYGTMSVLALDDSGSPRGPVRRVEGVWRRSSFRERSSVWDGTNVVIAHWDELFELSPDGRTVSTTPVESAVVAVGTLDGILVLSSDPEHGSNNGLRLVERGTGRVLEDFGSLAIGGFYAITGSVIFGEDAVYLATSSYLTRDALVWATLACSDI